jgi:hypothetical protein
MLQRQLPDLGVQRFHVRASLTLFSGRGEDLRGAL